MILIGPPGAEATAPSADASHRKATLLAALAGTVACFAVATALAIIDVGWRGAAHDYAGFDLGDRRGVSASPEFGGALTLVAAAFAAIYAEFARRNARAPSAAGWPSRFAILATIC